MRNRSSGIPATYPVSCAAKIWNISNHSCAPWTRPNSASGTNARAKRNSDVRPDSSSTTSPRAKNASP